MSVFYQCIKENGASFETAYLKLVKLVLWKGLEKGYKNMQ